MLVAGETLRADELREQLGHSPDVLDLDAAQIEAQRALANEAYLSLRLPASSVLFIDDKETLSRYGSQQKLSPCFFVINVEIGLCLQCWCCVLDLDSAQIEAQRALASQAYLSLRLPANLVLFIDDNKTLSRYVSGTTGGLFHPCRDTDCLCCVAVSDCISGCVALGPLTCCSLRTSKGRQPVTRIAVDCRDASCLFLLLLVPRIV